MCPTLGQQSWKDMGVRTVGTFSIGWRNRLEYFDTTEVTAEHPMGTEPRQFGNGKFAIGKKRPPNRTTEDGNDFRLG